MLRKRKTPLFKAISANNERALMVQLNADIESAAQNTVRAILEGTLQRRMSYPPNHGLTEEEFKALDFLKGSPQLESALRKVIADAASVPVFRLLTYIDGVADPDTDAWEGIYLVDRPDEDSDIEVADTSYHDQLYACYWDWRKIRPTKDWKLDTIDGSLS